MFRFIRNCQILSPRGWTILLNHQQHGSVPDAPHPRQRLLLSLFRDAAVLVGVWRCLALASICVCLMSNAVEHIFMCLLALRVFSFVNCLFKSVAHFKTGLFDLFFFFPDTGLLSDR